MIAESDDARLDAAHSDMIAAAATGAATAKRLAEFAAALVDRLDKDDPMETQDVLQAVAVLTKMANEAGASARAMIQPAKREAAAAKKPPTNNRIAAGMVANLSERRAGRKA